MKIIRSFSLFLFLFSLNLQADLPTSAYFCLVNAQGEVPVSSGKKCSGPALLEANISYFKHLYTEPVIAKPHFSPTARIFHPLIVQSTSKTTNQMLKASDLKKFSLQTNANQLNLLRLPEASIFGGSVSEGQIVIPDRNQIHIAKRKILATLFLSPDAYGGADLTSQIAHLLDPTSDVAENLLKLAQTYGFGGYFINPEASYAASHKEAFGAFMKKLVQLGEAADYPLHLEWYVVGSEDFHDTVANPTDGKISGGTFVDHFAWDGAKSAWAALTATERESYNPFEFKYGAYGVGDLPIILANYATRNSVAFFQYNSVINPGQVFERESHKLFISKKEQLLLSDETAQDNNARKFWTENAASFPPYPISYTLPFYTNFSTGKGKDLYRQGQAFQFGPWNSIGLLSPLPDLALLPPEVTFDYLTVYEGGNSLRIDLDQKRTCCEKSFFCCRKALEEKTIPLYTALGLEAKGKSLVAHMSYLMDKHTKGLTQDNPLQLCLGDDTSCCFTLEASAQNWQQMSLPINGGGTCKLDVVDSLSFRYTETDATASVYLGEFFVEEANPGMAQLVLLPEEKTKIQSAKKGGSPIGGSVLSWEPDPKALFYDLYLRGAFMGASPHNSFWFEEDDLDKKYLKVIPVYPGSHPSLDLSWSPRQCLTISMKKGTGALAF